MSGMELGSFLAILGYSAIIICLIARFAYSKLRKNKKPHLYIVRDKDE